MTNDKPTFYFVNAHAGSGKTYSAHQFISRQGGNFTIATQTNELSTQQQNDLLTEHGINAKVISLQNSKAKTCTEQYVRHCKDLRESTVLINQKVALQELEAARNQHLIVDEFPSPVERFTLNEDISATRSFIGNLIKAVPCEFEDFLEVIDTADTAELAESGKKKEHSLKEHVVQISERIHSPHYRVFVSETNYIGFISGLPDEEGVSADHDESKKRLVLYAWLQPSILKTYRSVTFMGANFPNQKLFHYWKDKVNWVEHPEIKGVRYDDFSHKAPLIDFMHMNEGDLVSWNHLSKHIGYENFKESVADVIAAEFPNRKYLVTLSAKDDWSWNDSSGKVISPNPVGLNAFQDRSLAVHLAPLRPSNMDFAVWEAVAGVSAAELMISQACEMQYQFFTRTAARDGIDHTKCEDRLTFITIDLAIADYLREVFRVEKPSELLVVPALNGYVKPARKTRSDKKPDDVKLAAKSARQKQRRIEERAAKAAAVEMTM
ncbi:hypothetical protein [Rhizobium grahamii]|uniref:Uncharacterized protein n=1 Tax=Rhizobium grahamii TaxID=1120045 RepID=A0A370KQH8_9HYPH|nr:hypothetical protein [Rhizobium grahamii]RDJ11647.1 hypothetical protein B5K06_12305 [Rhizobium grahamii]